MFTVVVIDHKGQHANCTSIYTKDPLVAEQVAIALAIVNDSIEVIFSYSGSAIRYFANGRMAPQALRINQKFQRNHVITCSFDSLLPSGRLAVSSTSVNPLSFARALIDRSDNGQFEAVENRDIPSTYKETLGISTSHAVSSRRLALS
ncbi:hypothetical protein HPB50_000043 [Hyalomma asiaticum]|uniref:Uncharacterized protein n=1 Tax=Hyalomma asiaticum TaxID=266040 RepID=A0ACB7SQZ7_HYAAI|nr:hypothetical protein HPB50_000043 [Hyalomma asiaticum]